MNDHLVYSFCHGMVYALISLLLRGIDTDGHQDGCTEYYLLPNSPRSMRSERAALRKKWVIKFPAYDFEV